MERELFQPENDTKIFCITKGQQKDFQRIYGTPDERIYQLPPGINERFATAWKLRENRAAGTAHKKDREHMPTVFFCVFS